MDCLRLGQELVLVNHRGHGYFAVAIVHSNYFAFAAHANAFSQGDFRGRVRVNSIREPGAMAESR